ncbi:unnamed protein product, partial [Didymodactylos carnosus]
SSDESSACYEQLFNQLRFISAQECNRPYLVNYLMADGALDADIHALQLSFSDDIFNRGSLLLTQKWSADPAIQQFQQNIFLINGLQNYRYGMKVQHSIYLQRTMAVNH